METIDMIDVKPDLFDKEETPFLGFPSDVANEMEMTDIIDVKPDLLDKDETPFLGFPSDVAKRKRLPTFDQNYCQKFKCGEFPVSKHCFVRLDRVSENHVANETRKCCTLKQVTTLGEKLGLSLNKMDSKIKCEECPEPKQCFVSIQRLSQRFLENESWKCFTNGQNCSINPKFISKLHLQQNFGSKDDKNTLEITSEEKTNNELKMTDLIDVKPDLLENDDPPFLGFPSDVPKRKTLQTFYQNYCQHDKCNKVLESKQCFIRLERLSENHMANDSKKCCTLEQVTTFSQGLEVSLNKINSKINCEVFPEPKQCFVSIQRLSQHFLENESWKCSAISQNFSVNPKFISRIPHQRNFCCEDDKSTVKVTIKEKPNKCSLNQKYPARIQRVSHQQMFGSKDVMNTIEIIGVEKTNVGLANDNQCCYNDCKKTLSLKQNLVGHTDAVHIKLKPFKCWECEKYFSFKSVLRKHVQSAHENLKPYECCECKKYFAYKCSLITHIKSVHEKLKPFKYFKFETQANFDLRNNDLQPKPNAGSESNSGFCKVWNAGLQNKREKTHSSCVTEPKNNRTSDYVHSLVAETSFFRPSKIGFSKLKYKRDRKIIPKNILSENVHKKVRRSLNSYQCNKCDSEFGSMKNFTKHVQSVHPGFKNFKCSECSWAFSERYNLYRHIRSVHRNLRPFSCSHCGRAFSDKSILALHIEAVHFKLKPFDCPECNVAFRSKAHLTRHINVVHRKLKPFTCDICGYAASCHPVIIRHINAVHLGLKLHKCDECDASFDCKSNLIRHVKCIHRNLRPFKCHKCSYAARCKGSLIGHMSYVHETARLFKCRECDKAFKGRTSLSSHSRIHAKCKPFKCNDCEISFAAKFILARHIKTTHSI